MKDFRLTIKPIEDHNSKKQSRSNISQENSSIKSNSQNFKLYLQIIKLSSENELLKNQIYQQKIQINRLRQFEKVFNQTIKTTHSIIQERRSEVKNNKNEIQVKKESQVFKNIDAFDKDRWGQYNLAVSQYKKHPTFESLAIDTAPNQQYGHNNYENYLKLKEYEYFGKLNFNEERQTVKSVYQSSDSLTLFHLGHDNVQMPVSHKKMCRESVPVYWTTEKEDLIIKEVQDSSNLQQKQSQTNIFAKQINTQNRQTAYFQLDKKDSQASSQIIEAYEQNSKQQESYKQLFQYIRQNLSTTKSSIKEATQILSKTKCLPLSEYFQLLQMRRDFKVNNKKVKLLEQEIVELKNIILKYIKQESYKTKL